MNQEGLLKKIVITADQPLEDFMSAATQADKLGVAIQTTGLDAQKGEIICIAFCWSENYSWCLPIWTHSIESHLLGAFQKVRIYAQMILQDESKVKILCDDYFTCKFLNQKGFPTRNYRDISSVAHFLDQEPFRNFIKNRLGFKTDASFTIYLKSFRPQWYEGISERVFYSLSCMDAFTAFMLDEKVTEKKH